MKKAICILGILACLPILVYVLLLGASHVYVSGGLGEHYFLGKDANPVWEGMKRLDLPGLKNPGPIRVEQVGAGHAIRNSLFMLCTAALAAVLPLLCFVVGIPATVFGLLTADWDIFGGGLLMAVIAPPLAVMAAVVGLLVAWLSLLVMPCTPAYIVLWLVVGLPFTALGALGGAAPTVTVIVIVK